MTSDPTPNPFAYRRPQRRSGLLWIAAIGLVLASTVFVAPRVCNWLLMRQLTSDIDSLPSDSYAERLVSIARLGLPAIPVLVKSICHEDRAIARSALEVLKEQQDLMMQHSEQRGAEFHFAITMQIAQRLPEVPPQRYPWIAELLNRTLLDTLSIDLEPARVSYRRATLLLADIAERTPIASTPESLEAPPVANEQLQPVASSVPESTLLPLERVGTQQKSVAITSPPTAAIKQDLWVDPSRNRHREAEQEPEPVIESHQSMQPLMVSERESHAALQNTLQDASQDALTIGGSSRVLSADDYPTGNPLESYATRAVIDLLASIREPLSQAARVELRRRGLSPAELELALRLASDNASVRSSVIDDVVGQSQIDPRRWLVWLAEDSERSVRLQALAVLGTMDDPNVARHLRSLLSTEQDPSVAARIRQALLR